MRLTRRELLAAMPLSAASAAQQAAGSSTAKRLNAQDRYALFRKHLEIRGTAITNQQFAGVKGLDDWKRRRPEIRRMFMDSLGLEPLPPRTPLNAKVTGGFEQSTFRVENVVFESMPGLFVTGNLYLPKTPDGQKSPTILYVCGHSPSPLGAKVEYQRHGVYFAQNGFVSFVLDTIEFGEISGIHHGTHDLEMWYWLSLGYSPAAAEVWNAMRALDYLETRSEVDTSKFGITGRSGGGAITWFTAAADDRIKVAAPVHGTWTIGPHVVVDAVHENCDCIYFWNPWQLDLSTVGALIAPRPLKIVNATKDESFPPEGYRRLFEMLKPVYYWYGSEDKISEFELPTGHQDLPPYRKEANEWLSRWLTGKVIPFDESNLELADKSKLQVLQKYPTNARNEGIHKDFIRTREITAPKNLSEWQKRRTELVDILRTRVFRAFPDRKVPFESLKAPERGWTTRYADAYNVEFTTDESLRVHGQLFIPRNGKAKHPALVYVKGETDVVYGVDFDNLLSAFNNHVVLVLKPRAVDYPIDNYRLAATKMTAGLLGTTVEGMQLWDVLRSLDYLLNEEKLPLSSISLYGRKEMSAVCMYAAALDERITRVIVDDPPESHWTGPAFLNVLRYTDIPEVAALLMPRELVSLTRWPAAFGITRAVAALHGSSKAIREARALGDALRVWEY